MSRTPASERELNLEERIKQQLVKSGERERLKRLLREKLTECGWRDDIKQRCREHIERSGREQLTTEQILRAVRPEGRAAVPDAVKAELLANIKETIARM